MKRILFPYLLAAAFLWPALANPAEPGDLIGKWSVNKTTAEGQAYTQTINMERDRLTFLITDAEGLVRFYAEGKVSLENLGPFQAMRITDIKAGESKTAAEPVEGERVSLYQLREDSWTIASNFDKVRDQKPVADTYRKVRD